MRCFALAFLAVGYLLTGHVAAGDGGGSNLPMGGVAPPVCSFTAAPRALKAENMSLSGAGQNSASISVDQLVDGTSGVLKRASIQLEILGVCNQSHYLSVLTSRGGLALEDKTAVVSGNFLNHVNYRAQVDWAGHTATLNTDATAGKKSSAGLIDGPNRGALNISLVIDESNNDLNTPALVGNYVDSLIVQIGLPL